MYVFPNAAPQAAARLHALATVFDPGTIRHLEARGVGHGWSCLEVGGGLGTVTRWLSDCVGQRGQVLSTDIDTRHLDSMQLPNVEVRRHDIVADPLPEAAFDLAYTRLVLEHVSEPDRALARMVGAVKPGGWVVVEEFEILPASPDPQDGFSERISKTAAAHARRHRDGRLESAIRAHLAVADCAPRASRKSASRAAHSFGPVEAKAPRSVA